MVTNCEIRFDNNPNGIFKSGQTLTGSLILNLTEKKKFRALYLRIEGYAKVQWLQRKGSRDRRTSVTYNGREDYLNQTTYLFGSNSGSPIEIKAGVTTYNFACLLPIQLPSSFEGKHGNVRYSAKAVLDRPWKTDKEFRISFSVIKTEDLNALSPNLRMPSSLEIVRHFYCCCLKSKAFNMSAEIPFSGYVSGQSIDVTMKLNNQSNVDVEGTKITLERITQYESQTPRKKVKYETYKICEAYGLGVSASGSTEVSLSLVVPPIAPTNTAYCKVIKVIYQLRAQAKVTGAHKNPFIILPITIGTIPLRESNLSLMQAPQYDLVMNSSIASTSHPTAPSFVDLPPPSYEEAVRVVPEMTNENEADVSVFLPLYPVWNFQPQPQMPSSPPKVPLP